jgi:hypothetical protein
MHGSHTSVEFWVLPIPNLNAPYQANQAWGGRVSMTSVDCELQKAAAKETILPFTSRRDEIQHNSCPSVFVGYLQLRINTAI